MLVFDQTAKILYHDICGLNRFGFERVGLLELILI